MTTAETLDFDQYSGKKVVLTLVVPATEGGEPTTRELEGKAEAANALGVMLKPKGKTGLELFEAEQIVSISYAPEKEKELKAKTLKLVEYGNSKQHLVDRHGYKLAEINAMSEQDAFDFHAENDHVVGDLGHLHGDTTKKVAESDDESSEDSTE